MAWPASLSEIGDAVAGAPPLLDGGRPSPSADGHALAIEILKYRLERQNAAQSYNGEMAKWILASLIVVNGAPFLLATKDLPLFTQVLIAHAWYFMLAVSFAIICGFCAWLNTGMREAVGGYQVERMLADSSNVPVGHASNERSERISERVVQAAYVAALLSGFGSLTLFVAGSITISSNYAGEAPASTKSAAK